MYKTHGMYGTPTHKSWISMKQRCDNKNNASYRWYGGRGISYAPKWKTFEGFYEDMGDRPKGTSLDRKKSNENYSKSNCCWSDWSSQANNRSNNKIVCYKGRKQTLANWCRELDINYKVVSARMCKSKWTVEQAFETPCRGF